MTIGANKDVESNEHGGGLYRQLYDTAGGGMNPLKQRVE